MRHQRMPDQRLKRLHERRSEIRRRLDDYCGVGELGQGPPWIADDAVDGRAELSRELHRIDEVDGHVVLARTSPDREHDQCIALSYARHLQPLTVRGIPAV